MRNRKWILTILALALVVPSAAAQQSQRPLNNSDIVNMVKSKLPEGVVISAIRSNPGKYDTSADALIALHKAGVTENELNAMMAPSSSSSGKGSAPTASESAPTTPPEPPASKSRMPKVYLLARSRLKELPLEKTQLAETKTKPSSMSGLAGDSAVAQAMQAGINTASVDTAMHMNSAIGGSTVEQAGSVFSGIMAHRQPKITYVWGVPGPSSGNILQTTNPSFTVDFSRTPGINPDEYEPAIVKLTPAQNTCRIVGATQGKEDASSTPAADWQVYSHFLEERVAAPPQKVAPGKYKIAASAELAPGEYGLVLRPLARTKKFSGGDVARAQGDGLMFDAIWTFQIADSAQ